MQYRIYTIISTCLLTVSTTIYGQQEDQESLEVGFNIHRIFIGTGDHAGWKIGVGAEYPLSDRIKIGLETGLWISLDYGDDPLFKKIDGYPTIDIYPDNYPFPDILISQEDLTDYGVKSYTPQNNFWQSVTADIFMKYELFNNKKWNFQIGAGASLIRTDYTYINEEWSAELIPPGSEDIHKFRMIIPLYVRYLDVGSRIDMGLERDFGRFKVALDLVYYEYTTSRNFSYGLSMAVGI